MEIETALAPLAALAQEARLRVFRLLVRAGPEGRAAGEIAEALGCPPPTLSFHLRHLVSAGLIESRRDGRSIVYTLRTDAVRDLIAFLTEDCCQGRRSLCVPVGAPPRTKVDEAAASGPRQSVVFVCAQNSARSQMAEALLRRHAGHRFEVGSAGIRPAPIHPLAIRVMDEIGIDLRTHDVSDLGAVRAGPPPHLAIVVCDQAQADCRGMYPFALRRLFWPFEDPAASEGSEEERLAIFREVRDAIDARIRAWLAEEDAKRARA